jgi:hypothetical protein
MGCLNQAYQLRDRSLTYSQGPVMKRKLMVCLLAIPVAFVLFSNATGVNRLPGEDPTQFRNGLHGNFAYRHQSGPAAVPQVLPAAPDIASKAALTFQDVQISVYDGPAGFAQDDADLAALKGGRMAVVWEDDREGPVAVYLQMLDHFGALIGDNRSLISGSDFNVVDPHVCADTAGNFYVVWREERNGYLQAARFDSLANVLTPVFFVSDTIMGGYAGEFDAACLASGRLAVVWENYAVGNDISLQVFNTNGSASTGMITVNSDGSLVRHWSPAVAIGPSGDIAVLWEDYRSDVADIFFRRFNSAGTPYAAEISLSDAGARDSARFLPAIAYSAVDGYTAGWIDLRSGQDIYLQRLTSSGGMTGANVLLSTGSSAYSNWDITLTTNSLGHLLAAWTVYGNDNIIMLQRYLAGVVPDGAAQVVSAATSRFRFHPAVAANKSANLAVVWTDLETDSPDLLGAFFANGGSVVKASFRINDDAGGSPAIEPEVTRFDRYEWDIVFTDKRRDAGDIMFQRVYVGGTLYGDNRRINADSAGGIQVDPAVTANGDKLCITWTDVLRQEIDGQNIFCRFSRPHYELTPEILVNDNVNPTACYTSDCAMTGAGVTLVVWTDMRSGTEKVYGQLFTADNTANGGNFLIGPSVGGQTGETPLVSADSSGSFIVTYLNRLASAGPAVEVRQVTTLGVVTPKFSFVSDQSGYEIDGFGSGVGFDGSVFLAWHAFGVGQTALFATVFNASGTVLFPSEKVTDDDAALPGMPSAAVDNQGFFLITWLDNRTGEGTPFRQIFDPTFTRLQANLPVYGSVGRYMQAPVTAAYRGRGVFVWSDARSQGLQVYASQELYSPTDADDQPAPIPAWFDLEQNFPNPFNPSTTIRFSLARAGEVQLAVINVLGQKVRTLIDGYYPAGTHSVVWDGTIDGGQVAASGVYFYRLISGAESRTRAMSLLK